MLISLSVLAVGANAINLVKPRGSPSVIEFGLKRSHFSSEDLQKRSSADLPVDNLIVSQTHNLFVDSFTY